MSAAAPSRPGIRAGLKYLKQLELVGVHRMRLLSVVDAADQAWTAPAAQDAAGSQARLQLGPGVAWGGWEQLAAQGAASAPADEAPTTPAPAAQQPPVAAQHDELAPVAAPSQRQQQERGAAGAAAAAAAAVHSGPMLWGELYAREPRRGLAALLPRQRGDVGERLISRVRKWKVGEALLVLAAHPHTTRPPPPALLRMGATRAPPPHPQPRACPVCRLPCAALHNCMCTEAILRSHLPPVLPDGCLAAWLPSRRARQP